MIGSSTYILAMPDSEAKQRMLRGEEYQATDEQLTAERERCSMLCERINALSAADEPARLALFRELLGAMGDDTLIQSPFRCDYGYNIKIGRRSFINYGGIVLDVAPVTIGDEVLIATNVQILTATHPLDAARRRAWWEFAKPISIADGVWIGGGALILPGVSVGENAVVGAGAVVTRDVAANTVVVGNPARVVREL
jgi:maltose O-acetyltransferase